MFEYINENGVTCYSSTGIVPIDDNEYKVVNDTASNHEVLFIGTLEDCKLYLHYYNQHMYTAALRRYVHNIRDLKLWIM